MKRRMFFFVCLCIAGIGSQAWAQGTADLPRVAILSPDFAGRGAVPLFLEALRNLGYVDGRNIRIDTRFAENRLDQLPAIAAELVKARPDVIFTYNTAGAFAAARATTSIPIVAGPVAEETMAQLAGHNFARPVANITGFTTNARGQDEKCLQLLKEAAPNASRIAILLTPANPVWRDYPKVLKPAADELGLVLIRVETRGAADIARVLGQLATSAIDGLFLVGDSTLAGDADVRARVISFARDRRLPSASATSIGNTFARDGGLLQLGSDLGYLVRRAAEYVHRIIRGAQPRELPVERMAKFQLLVNLTTAKALGLAIPQSILARADEVIE
jgi:putative ABC transport system substrate-binding protein